MSNKPTINFNKFAFHITIQFNGNRYPLEFVTNVDAAIIDKRDADAAASTLANNIVITNSIFKFDTRGGSTIVFNSTRVDYALVTAREVV